jgi:hypothetical protein
MRTRFDMDPLTRLRRDLGRLTDLLRWAHNDAYRPEGQRDRAAPNYPAVIAALIAADADYVPSRAVRDIGVGNDRRRNAYAAAVQRVCRAEVYAAQACRVAGQLQPPMIQPRPHYALGLVTLAVARIRIRADRAATVLAPDDLADLIEPATFEVDQAVRVLDAAFSEGRAGRGVAKVANPCRNAARGCPSMSEPGRTRCWPCYVYHRDHGTEKPKRLLKVRLGAAQAAAERRAARGEGYGDT